MSLPLVGREILSGLPHARHSEESWLVLMPDAELKYSINAVKRAGKALRDGCKTWDELESAMEIFENWRACHSYPLSQFYDSLSQYARLASPLTNVVQRPKRLEAVLAKMKRDPKAQLSTMQDIAGCRAIVKDIDEIDRLMSVCQEGWNNHELLRADDYVLHPDKQTGYRSVHLIYKFKSENQSFNNRCVEIQFRSPLQHAWATAVEIIDLFQKQTLKAGTGDPDWQRFFLLMASAIAKLENTTPVPETPMGQESLKELRYYAELLQVKQQIMAYGSLAKSVHFSQAGQDYTWRVDTAKSGYFVMELEPNLKTIQVRGYGQDQAQAAYRDVAKAERSKANVVLVAASDFEKLKAAYPNWILDTHNFLTTLNMTLGEMSDVSAGTLL